MKESLLLNLLKTFQVYLHDPDKSTDRNIVFQGEQDFTKPHKCFKTIFSKTSNKTTKKNWLI